MPLYQITKCTITPSYSQTRPLFGNVINFIHFNTAAARWISLLHYTYI